METATERKDNFDTAPLEQLLKEGKILEIGEVVMEDEPELEIPVYMEGEDEDDFIDRSRLPELVLYTGGIEKQGEVPAAFPYADESRAECTASLHGMRRRLGLLAEYLGLEKTLGTRVAETLGARTKRSTMQAFGNYMHDYLLSGINNRNMTAPEFVIAAHIALINLKNGFELGTGRPVRKSMREAFKGRRDSIYEGIKHKLPEIARAVATTGFAVELRAYRKIK